jgi:hypothetical protein
VCPPLPIRLLVALTPFYCGFATSTELLVYLSVERRRSSSLTKLRKSTAVLWYSPSAVLGPTAAERGVLHVHVDVLRAGESGSKAQGQVQCQRVP